MRIDGGSAPHPLSAIDKTPPGGENFTKGGALTANALSLLFFVGFPALVILLAQKVQVVKKVGAVAVCYAVGIAAGNAGLFPESAGRLQDTVTTAAIPLALPLMFFSLDLRRWLKAGARVP